jgi:hypothetical protein
MPPIARSDVRDKLLDDPRFYKAAAMAGMFKVTEKA